jgi:cullin-associated NEDD8-dissociated protein 1
MADAASAAKLRFLNASAHHYATIAPATSAYLMLRRNFEVADSGISLREDERGRSCKGCESILVPGRTSRTSIVSEGGTRSKAHSKKHHARTEIEKRSKFLRTDCLVCHRFEKKPLERSTISRSQKGSESKAQPTSLALAKAGASDPASPRSLRPATTNASSKQRAKARKTGGLQAMLEKSKASSTPSSDFGLDLLDLMKQA